jgi:hypothetical protein
MTTPVGLPVTIKPQIMESSEITDGKDSSNLLSDKLLSKLTFFPVSTCKNMNLIIGDASYDINKLLSKYVYPKFDIDLHPRGEIAPMRIISPVIEQSKGVKKLHIVLRVIDQGNYLPKCFPGYRWQGDIIKCPNNNYNPWIDLCELDPVKDGYICEACNCSLHYNTDADVIVYSMSPDTTYKDDELQDVGGRLYLYTMPDSFFEEDTKIVKQYKSLQKEKENISAHITLLQQKLNETTEKINNLVSKIMNQNLNLQEEGKKENNE